MTAAATATTTSAPVDLPFPYDADAALVALCVALWPRTADGDITVRVRVGGRCLDTVLTAKDGSAPLGGLALRLRGRSAAGGPYASVVDASLVDGFPAAGSPVVLALEPGGARLLVTDAEADVDLLAARIGAAARAGADPLLTVDQVGPAAAELDRMRTWVGRPVDYRGATSVDGVIAGIAVARPESIALRHGAATLTYGELLARADRLAATLRERGARRGSILVLRLPRGLDLVVAMLATLRCGAAYSAVDPEWPAARVLDVLADTEAPLLVGSPFPGYDGAVPSVSEADTAGGRPDAVPEVGRELDQGFCVYFTSGSTGRPKGVLSTHRGTLRTLLDPAHPRLGTEVVTLAAAPMPWDAFTLELWAPLLHGGVCTFPAAIPVTPVELRRAVDAGVNTVWLTASLFNVLVDEDLAAFDGLRQVLTGGERLSVPHVARFRRRHAGIMLANGYGPVETTVFATSHEISDDDLDGTAGIPVGRPLPGTEVLVLRTATSGELVRAAVGEPGEICVAGDGLAAGYLGAAARESDRFALVRPLGEAPVRVYRTGDLGSWRRDGVLLFHGRADRQVKVRGHRVEPGEIEAVALRDGLVRGCVVLPVRDGTRITALAAYVVPRSEPFDTTAFVAKLATILPDYLVPAHVVPLHAFPLGATGKLDTAAFPPATRDNLVTRERTAAPGAGAPALESVPDSLAELVARTAAEVLGLPAVALDDNLVGLGLDSLGATRLAARLARRLGREAQVAVVLRARTPRALAAALPPSREAADSTGRHALSAGQIAFWLDDLLRPEQALGNVVLLAFRFDGPIDRADLRAALRRVVARHDALRTAVAEDDGVPVPVPVPIERALRMEQVDTVPADPQEYAQRTAAELAGTLDLGAGPLVVVHTAPLPEGLLLVLAVHHAAFDGHSVALMAAEVSALLRGDALPPPRPYTAIAARQAAMAAAPGRRQLVAEWADRLRGTEDLRWPGPAPAGPESGGFGQVPIRLPVTAALRDRARQWRVTPYAVALTAYTGALAEVTGGDKFCIGTPVSDREPADDHTIGMSIATVAVPAVVGQGAAADAVARMAATVLDAIEHRGVPFTEVVRLLRRGSTGRHPVFQAQFAWQNHPVPSWDVPGVTVTELRLRPLAAQLELTLELWPAADDGPLTGVVEYQPARVTAQTARAVADAFARHLRGLCQSEGVHSDV